MIDKEIVDRWMDEYINNINLDDRRFICLRLNPIKNFINKNYYDKKVNRYVTGYSDIALLGLQYIDYSLCKEEFGDEYKSMANLLCVVPNNKGLDTIVAYMRFYDEFYYYKDQKEPITFIEYAETNRFFRNKGLYSEMVGAFAEYVDINQNILTTSESVIGFKCHTFDILKNELLYFGFNADIRTEMNIDSEYKKLLLK